MPTWKAQINKVLVEIYYESEGHLCAACVHERLPNMALADVVRTLESMHTDRRSYVSIYTATCSKCGKECTVYACD